MAGVHNPVQVARRIVAAHRDRAAVAVRRVVAHRVVTVVVHSRAAVVAHRVIAVVAGSDRCTLGKYLPVPGIIFYCKCPGYHKLYTSQLQELMALFRRSMPAPFQFARASRKSL